MKQYAVIGLGRFGYSVAKTLAEKGQQVLAIDRDEELVHDVMDFVTKAVCLDASDEKAARNIGLQNVDVAICGIGTNLEESILVTLVLKDLNVPEIICKASTMEQKKVLEKIGATKVILPEKDTGERIAMTLVSTSDTIIDHIGFSDNCSIVEKIVPAEFIGKSLRDLNIRLKYGVNVIAIKKRTKIKRKGEELEEETINVTPNAEDEIVQGDILVVFGENDKIENFKGAQ